MGSQIKGKQIRDETITEDDIKDGAIKAAEMSPNAIDGQPQTNTGDPTNDRLLIWDATDSALKKIAPNSLGISGGGGSPAGANTQIQYNNNGSFGGSPNLSFDGTNLSVSGKLKTTGIGFTNGDDAITVESGGYIKLHSGVKYSRGVKVSSVNSHETSNAWIKIATSSAGTRTADTCASTFLVTFAGHETSNTRRQDGVFLVTVKATYSSSDMSAIGTWVVVEPLKADHLSSNESSDFNPATDIFITHDGSVDTDIELYMKSPAKDKDCFVTHLGGSGTVASQDVDPGFVIHSGQSWSGSEPGGLGNKVFGTWASKVFSKLGIGTSSPTSPLHVYANTSDQYAVLIDQDENNNGHGLKITSDATGDGGLLLDVESASTTFFRIRGDQKVGIGDVGTSLPATLSVKGKVSTPIVNVKNSSGTAVLRINDAGDVIQLGTDTPSNNQVLTWDGAKAVWENVPDGGGGGGNTFQTIAVSGQSSVVADSATDTLTLVAGTNVTLTTNAGNDEVTIAASAYSGKVLQVVHVPFTGVMSSSSTSWTNVTDGNTTMQASITPSANSSKILIQVNANIAVKYQYAAVFHLWNGSATVGGGVHPAGYNGTDTHNASSFPRDTGVLFSIFNTTNTYHNKGYAAVVQDSPNTTSQVTYTFRGRAAHASSTFYVNRNTRDEHRLEDSYVVSSITLYEIGA